MRLEEIEAKISEGMEKVANPSPEYFLNGEVAAASLNAFSRIIQLKHPKVIVGSKLITIQSVVLLLSVSELLKHIKNKYKTPAENIFPHVVDDFIFEGKQNALAEIKRLRYCKSKQGSNFA